jgi:tetratricopeptide (TPR) repeat protein
VPQTFDEILRNAEDLFYQGEFTKALRLYSRALREESRQPRPWIGQILSLLLGNQTREAAIWAKRAVEAFPSHPAIISLQGLSLAMQGMTQRGLASSDYAMSLQGPDAWCWLARGWLLLEVDNDNWKICFSRAMAIAGEENVRFHLLLGMVLERHRKFVNSMEHYRTAAETMSGNAFLWHRLGLVYRRLGMPGKAVESQRRALEIRPNFQAASKEIRALAGFPLGAYLRRVMRLFRPGGA